MGLGLHGSLYSEGRIFRIVSQRSETSYELNKTVKLLYDSAWRELQRRGLDPDYYLPQRKFDNRREYFFPDTQSAVIVDTARGRGVGQSDRSDDLYITEYSEWDDAEDKRAALVGSVPVGAGTRISIDFNAKGIGNDAYVQYQAAKRKGQEDWNGFEALFYGTTQCPDIYDHDELARRRREINDEKKFKAVYPSNDEEVWQQDNSAVFDWDNLCAAKGEAFYCEKVPRVEYLRHEFYHGVDTAPGQETGDWEVMKSFAFVDGKLVEALPPIRTRCPEYQFAHMVDERARLLPGTVVVERNMGGAVLSKLKELETPGLFRYRDPIDKGKMKLGFNTTLVSKRRMIDDLKRILAAGEIELVSTNGITELRQFEWKDGHELAGAPDVANHYDDEAMATMLAVQGLRHKHEPARGGFRG